MREEYRYIFDFIFSGSEVSDELKLRFRHWLELHGDDADVWECLEKYWNETPVGNPDFNVGEGLERLLDSIERQKTVPESQTAKSVAAQSAGSHRALRWLAAVAAAVVVFAIGWTSASYVRESESKTVFLSSADNTGRYTLPDGTRVWLNRGSSLTYTNGFNRKERNVSLSGEGFFDVSRDEDRPFIVSTECGFSVRVLGTKFNVCNYPGGETSEVILKSGSVQILREDEAITLSPNQRWIADGTGTRVTPINASDCLRWYEGKLSFDNVRLGDILENLSHKCCIRISQNIGAIADERMSITIKDEPVNDILDILSSLLPISWRLEGNEIIINKSTKYHK